MNTGIKQATIAYKTTDTGEPVDIDGNLTSISGNKQAIALLVGYVNPDPNIYEVEFYFNPGEFIQGEPTGKIDLDSCPVSNFTISPDILYLYPAAPSKTVNVYSSFGWEFIPPFEYATVSPATSGPGDTTLTITRTDILGEGDILIRDVKTGEIKKIRVLNTDADGWILENGFWNYTRVWTASGVWNY